MQHVISVPLDPRLAEFIGKKGSEDSITFYNRKVDDSTIVALAPSSEDKFYAAAESMLISSQIVISTAALDKLFGEVLVAASLLDRHVIITTDNNIDQYLKGIEIKGHEFADRKDVLEKILSFRPKYDAGGQVRVDIDKSFPVRGLGTVALGIVTKGTIKQHQELYHSSGKRITVRSMQSQDVDVTSALPGTRIGIVPKGIEHDEIEKGDLFTEAQHDKKSTARVRIARSSGINPEKIEVGRYYDLISNFSYSRSKVEEISGDELALRFDRSTALLPGDELLLMRDKAPRIFASGRVL
ncbi:MAG: hypothetical protein LVQ95_04190 [Candidatus Micrarchaeales archaeon]|nr:hypothetical protein [Candidatus Micrarchaeales archaeon]